MANRIDSPEYWIESFEPTRDELDALAHEVLESARPAPLESLANRLVHLRVERATAAQRASRSGAGLPYSPADAHEKGQKLVFGALDGAVGTVAAVRDGNNPAYGAYRVIRVKLPDGEREFASGIAFDHELARAGIDVDADEVAARFGPVIAPTLRDVLSRAGDWVGCGDRWAVAAILPDINAGHCNLAEAIVMLAGTALPGAQILKELELDGSVPEETRLMALELALLDDPRFRNVGALESPLWALASQA